MASRAILRRRRSFIDQCVNKCFASSPSNRSLERAIVTTPPLFPYKHETTTYRDDSFNRLGLGQVVQRFGSALPRDSFSGFNAPIAVRWLSHSAAAAAKNREPDENNETAAANKRKEASPEECDQAVEGLTTAKAKAMAKRAQEESQKDVQSVLRRVWTAFLGIGPALRAVASMSREDWAKKLVHWKGEFVSTLQHYWLGSKLLWVDVRISSRLLLKLAGGKSLSRRERQQLTRTTADIFRLVPFAVFIIVPFMEFLLPVFLKLFPNMLPSTFQDKMKEQEALKRRLKARIEYARFLQDTVKEMAKEVQNTRSGELKKTAEDLDDFLNLIRRGATVSNEEILGFAKLFNDELTLDNISRPRLVNMCKYMGISPFGTDAYLRYMLRKHLRRIKQDDKLIQAEGVDSLSEAELREDCRERGMLGLLSVEEMRQQLQDWLDLSLNHSVPSSLLILSRSFTVSGKLKPEEAVQATLSSLPDEVVDTIQVTSLPSEDSVSERRRKLEFLEMQEELIKEEEERQEVVQARMESSSSQDDKALKEMSISTAKEAYQLAKDRAVENKEQLCELSRALAVLASASSVSTEREDFLRLVNKEIELYNSMVKKEGSDGEKDAFKAYKAARVEHEHTTESDEGDKVSSSLIGRVDAMLQNLEKEIDDVDAKIGDRWRLLDRDYDGKVTPEEVASAAMYLKNTLGKEGIQELVNSLSKDRDGKILVEDIVKLGSWREDGNAAEDETTTRERPPIIYGDVSRPKPMTVFWSSTAQSMTKRPMKGMLTGPVTILNWSFVRNDQPRSETTYQIALAIKDEVEDLEKAGITVIQIDEAALREGLPLRKSEQAKYLDWAVHSFRITNVGVQDTTQIHTHMCYSNFNDIIHSIIDMDADVITIENSRSDEKLLSVFREGVKYGAGIGPGVYDIHSPRIPPTEEIADRINMMLAVLEKNILWVNPDCGLKTRKYPEVNPALTNMVAATKVIRNKLGQ